MDRDQKRAAVAEIAEQIRGSDAVFAVDYRGISVPQAAELRTRLRDADATFRIVKNTLTERAADEADAGTLKALLEGPTALTFVHGDAALAAKAISGFARETDALAFKGGLLDGEPLDADQILAISRLPARDVLFGQLVGVVASPITGVVRTLNALISGLASQLGQIAEQRGGEGPVATASAEADGAAGQGTEGGEPPAATEAASAAEAAEEPPATETPDQDAEAPEPPASPEAPAEGAPDTPSTDQETTA
jgi:large subunit ribosomal protein L10